MRVEKQSEIPRAYVSTLEAQVRHLKAEIEELKRQSVPQVTINSTSPTTRDSVLEYDTPATTYTVSSGVSDAQDVVKSMGLVLLESSDQPRFVGTSSGITFAKMVLAAVKQEVSTIASPGRSRDEPAVCTPHLAMASSLPPRHAAQRIVDVYFSYRTPHIPILTRSMVEQHVERAYAALEQPHQGLSRASERDLFISYMVFSVGLWSIPMAGGTRSPQSEGCFISALQFVDKLLAYSPSNLETLTVMLLLAQYITLNPSKGSLWQLTGMSLRLCIDLGLHWETEAILCLPQPLLEERRRLYWATYRFDRLLAITLGRPFGIADQSMNTGYPSPHNLCDRASVSREAEADVHSQRAANHVLKLYRLESEIKHVLYHQLQGATLAYPRANYPVWFHDIQSRLRTWQDEIPDLSEASSESIYANQSWWGALWCNAILLLHRPNPLVPVPTSESLQTCFDVSCRSIQAIKTLQREGKVSVAWMWAHHLFLAGLTMIYCIWQSQEVRNAASIVDVMTAAQDCASTLSALTERFAPAGGCRDTFEGLSAATLKWLVARYKDGNAENQHPVLDNEIQALRENIPFSTTGWRVDEPTSIFPDEPFEFAEYLSAAAQWPGPNLDQNSVFNLQEMSTL
ncbi:hypothetical protein SLS62_002839 [Diatrype stigma]|uniref:Xylanolytic transcriptional activator regulatory domain-containing protein n=1 Tax=Diatrype stigma TaxID=117547 RepID=A0AAN9UTN3_9PEZI